MLYALIFSSMALIVGFVAGILTGVRIVTDQVAEIEKRVDKFMLSIKFVLN